ncbi:MAG: helix-turn-helix domain-containing protein [Gammaproteobacteria bacterium]|nr:helix-turn-helix domain-containing protein [Gammaproteobacteria bacterium]MBU2006014.1 helix-turn-helix domain-containing protein [Gammaproteobacteria bacterium]
MAKKYIVRLDSHERGQLEQLVKVGKAAAYKRQHAQILLKADIGPEGPGWGDIDISEAFDVSTRTVERVRQRLVEGGLEAALCRAKQERYRTPRLDGEGEAHLVTLACSEPPEGYARWTLRLLADRLVELEVVEAISHETVRQVLKKHHQTVAKAGMVHPA